VRGLTRMLQIASMMLGVGLILFGFSRVLWLSILLMIFIGFGLMQTAAVTNTIVQSLVSEDKRARVMSYYTMAFVGSAPFGSLMAGIVAHRIGAPHTTMVTGSFCVLGSLWFMARRSEVKAAMRPIYREKGLIPPAKSELAREEVTLSAEGVRS
jgi:MFS family permease